MPGAGRGATRHPGQRSLSRLRRHALGTVGIILVQVVWSWVWLRHFRYGPTEWLWRCLSWWQPAPIRR
ncbi:MAG: DUF418 domain-containing protein [Pseudonocardiaceae bacterium]